MASNARNDTAAIRFIVFSIRYLLTYKRAQRIACADVAHVSTRLLTFACLLEDQPDSNDRMRTFGQHECIVCTFAHIQAVDHELMIVPILVSSLATHQTTLAVGACPTSEYSFSFSAAIAFARFRVSPSAAYRALIFLQPSHSCLAVGGVSHTRLAAPPALGAFSGGIRPAECPGFGLDQRLSLQSRLR
jgi:hypothetical protein